MFTPELLISYVTAVSILVIMPGVDSLLTVTMTKSINWRAGVLVAIGNGISGVTLTVISALLIAGFLSLNETVNMLIQTLSSLYLLRMGWQIFLTEPSVEEGECKIQNSKIITTALVSNLSNPKAITFFLLLIPQFVTATTSVDKLQQSLTLGLILNAIGFIYLTSLALLASKLKMSFMKGRHTNHVIGILFILISLYMMFLRFS